MQIQKCFSVPMKVISNLFTCDFKMNSGPNKEL